MRAPGKLFKWWQVYCAGCTMASPMIGQCGTLAMAAKELRQKYGWKVRENLWRCPNCHGGNL